MPKPASEFEQRFLPHLDAAYNLARWLARDAAAADDIVQEAMLRALRFHDGLRGDPKPWLLQIVRNVAYVRTAARRRANEVQFADDQPDGPADFADPGATPEQVLEGAQDRRTLDDVLAALPADLRECLVLRELEEMSYKEIAQITGAPIGTVMSRLFRARQALMGTARRQLIRARRCGFWSRPIWTTSWTPPAPPRWRPISKAAKGARRCGTIWLAYRAPFAPA